MKSKYYFHLALLVLITAVLTVFDVDSLYKSDVDVYSNRQSGFYLNTFQLILSHSDTTSDKYVIRYTFDGSEPNHQSELFKEQLLINGNESYSGLSFIKTTIADSISKFPEKWVKPVGEQEKATIVRFAAFRDGKLSSRVKTLSFFIKNSSQSESLGAKELLDAERYVKYGLPVISISTDRKNLYSDEKGLFVVGDYLDVKNRHSGNFFERGKEFEREVYFQYFDSAGILDFELSLGMRIHGGVSRRFPQKSIKFYKRKKYDKSKIDFPFLASKGVKRFIVEGMQESGGGRALIEDIVAQEIVKGVGLEQQTFQAVIVFINGEYFGLYSIRDRIDEHYLAYKFNLHRDSFDVIDGHADRGFSAIHGDNTDFLNVLSFIKENNLSKLENYEFIASKIDIDNLINYYAIEIFFANLDWPIHNIKMWKRKKNGKWRFLLYDLDGGFSHKTKKDLEEDHTVDMFDRLLKPDDCRSCKNTTNSTVLFRGLSESDVFRQKFGDRYKEIIDLYMSPLKTLPIVDSVAKIYAPYIPDHIKRWGFPRHVKKQWERDIDANIKYFLENREASTLKNLNSYMIDYDD